MTIIQLVTITDYMGLATELHIPSVLDGYKVTNIGGNAFRWRDDIVSVILPDGILSIAGSAFRGCDALVSITVPISVTAIGNYAFDDCRNITDAYYGGAESDWEEIAIGTNNSDLTNATIHYRTPIVTVTTTTTTTVPTTMTSAISMDAPEKGDLNGDGKVTIMDAVMLYYHVNGKTPLGDEGIADVTGDGKINSSDAVKLYYFVNGKIEVL